MPPESSKTFYRAEWELARRRFIYSTLTYGPWRK
jgi:hypothetical protein